MTRHIPLITVCLLSSVCYAANQPYSTYLNAGVLYDDNVGRAVLAQDEFSDTIYNLGVTGKYRFYLPAHNRLTLSAGIDRLQYQDFDGLSNTLLFAGLSYKIRPKPGSEAPWYLVALEYGVVNYNSSLRDNDFLTLELSAGRDMTDNTSLRAGLVLNNVSADVEEFDTDYWRLFLSVDYYASAANIIYLTLAYTDGETASSTTDVTHTTNKTMSDSRFAHQLPSGTNTGPLRADDAFRDSFVYKLDTESVSLKLGDNYALSDHQFIDASVLYYDTDSFGGSTYDGIILQLNYQHRFE